MELYDIWVGIKLNIKSLPWPFVVTGEWYHDWINFVLMSFSLWAWFYDGQVVVGPIGDGLELIWLWLQSFSYIHKNLNQVCLRFFSPSQFFYFWFWAKSILFFCPCLFRPDFMTVFDPIAWWRLGNDMIFVGEILVRIGNIDELGANTVGLH